NAVHCFAHKRTLFDEAWRVLRPGGIFAFNSAFYEGSRPPGTEPFYREWVRRARSQLRQDPTAGEGDRQRDRPAPLPLAAHPWLTADEYAALLQGRGFALARSSERTVDLTAANLRAIASYSEFAAAWFSRYNTAVACEALRDAVSTTMDRLGL